MTKPSIYFANELDGLLKPLQGQLLKLIIHVGTPKTGTTSIQSYLDKKQGKLRRKGILYPHNHQRVDNPNAPKHQWFEKNLVSTHLDNFLENMANMISQVKQDTHTIVLSSEGIYNYWWDFPDESKAILSQLAKRFDIEIWAWFREPLDFIEAYYKQCIRNPQVENNPCYGKDLSFSDMLDIDWFSQHLDYQGFINECQTVFGKNKVSAFKYEGDVLEQFIHKLGLPTNYDRPFPRQNKSLNLATVALLKVLNHYDVKARDKSLLMPHIREINELIGAYSNDSLIDKAAKKRVLALARPILF